MEAVAVEDTDPLVIPVVRPLQPDQLTLKAARMRWVAHLKKAKMLETRAKTLREVRTSIAAFHRARKDIVEAAENSAQEEELPELQLLLVRQRFLSDRVDRCLSDSGACEV